MKNELPEKEGKIRKEYEIVSTPPRTKISLWFDGYDDIFSDFDPRSYSRRLISDDFLNELKKVVSEVKTNTFDITFLIPRNKVNHTEEKIIQSRLHHYFQKEALHYKEKYRNMLKKGFVITVLGMVSMLFTVTIEAKVEDEFLANLLTVIFEPTGWFAVWYGLDHIFYVSKYNKKFLNYTSKVLGAEINFDAY